MRLRVIFQVEQPTAIPLNYQYQLASAIYHYLEEADADYARFLHGEGYAPPGVATTNGLATSGLQRRFKLFTFSMLWPTHSQPRGETLHLLPGTMEWFVTSPMEKFVREFATGLLASGALRIDRACLPIVSAETLSPPEFRDTMRYKCLSPIVAAVHDPDRPTPRYLRPGDPDFSERLRHNLLAKYAALHARTPHDDRLTVTWDAAYLQTHKGTKLVNYKGVKIVGAWCPFTMCGSRELVRVAYECGLGEKNAGFGMIETVDQ